VEYHPEIDSLRYISKRPFGSRGFPRSGVMV
jgi:hypothetical protein